MYFKITNSLGPQRELRVCARGRPLEYLYGL